MVPPMYGFVCRMKTLNGGIMTNEQLDEAVLEIIQSGITKAGTIHDRIHANQPKIGFRDIDRSLQRLRKKKSIEYGNASKGFVGWKFVA
jgi:Fe2+ or Zn2+ uptake regulation protein